jgi:hypothetical protein
MEDAFPAKIVPWDLELAQYGRFSAFFGKISWLENPKYDF